MIYKSFWMLRAILYKLFFGRIGRNSYLGRPLFIYGAKNIFIGNRVRIFPHSRMETHGDGRIIIEDNCGIGQRFHITAGGELIIKKNSLLVLDVMVTDIDHEYQDIDMPVADQPLNVAKTEIGENCFIGAGVKIQAGTILGRNCIVGSNSVLRGTYPSYSVIVGVPGRVIKHYNFETKKWERL